MNASWKPIHPDEDKFVTTALTMVKKAGAVRPSLACFLSTMQLLFGTGP